MKVELPPAAKAYVIEKGYDPMYGASPLRRFHQHTVENLVGRKIIADEVVPGELLVVDCEDDQLKII
jgi:ATP-dependent Clp protease ATP-binding subunit ClpB